MSHAGGYKSRTWNVSGVTPFVSCAIFFIVGTSLTLIYAFAYVGCVALAEGFAVNVQLARYCYQTRQLITLFAALGVALALLLGLGGRISCLLEQWLLAACYFSCAAYIQANQFNIHFNVIALMRFAAAAAVLSGMAQTAAIYCMSDCAMPGGSPYSMNRITAFFVGCTVAGPLISFWIMGKQYLDVETAIVGSLQFMSESCATLTFLCCLAGTLCVVSAAITTYLFFTIDHNLVIEEVPWFPVLLRSPCRLSSATLRRHLKTLYMPLLWTVNPLFIALAIGATLNSTTSVKLIFWQHLIYSMCAIISVSFLYLLYGDPVCATRDTLKQKVLKTTTLTCDGEDSDEASCRSKLFDGAQLRPMSHKSLGDHCMPRVSRSTQWGLLRGVLWSEWQKHDSTYELCQGPLRSIHEALEAFQCLESTNLYDNVLPMMQQYRSMINCTGMLHGFPFSIDPNWGPLEQLHHMLLHQRMVLMSQFERTGKMYADTLRASLPKVFCGFFERIRRLRLCCTSVVASIATKSENCGEDHSHGDSTPHQKTVLCSEMPDFAKAMPNCKCCCKDEQTSIQNFLTESIGAASQLCAKMLGDMRRHEMLQDTLSKPNYGDLATEKELVCVLLEFCESNMLIVAALLMIEEYLVLQEWLCKLAWHIDDIRWMLNKRGKCTEHSKEKCKKEQSSASCTTSCTWECIQNLLAEICALLTKIHNCKIKLLLRLRETSGCCVAAARPDLLCDDIDPTVLLATTRLLVIVVLALLGLLSLEEGLTRRSEKSQEQQEQTQPSSCTSSKASSPPSPKAPSSTPCSCKGSHYDLAFAATEYLCVVTSQLSSLDPNRIEKLQDNVVSWYSGLTKSMWQMCPDSTLYERYNYAFQIHEDVEPVIPLPDEKIFQEYLKNCTAECASSVDKCREAFRGLKECEFETKCEKESCKTCTQTEAASETEGTNICSCPVTCSPPAASVKQCEDIKTSVENLVKCISSALSCTEDVGKCTKDLCVLTNDLEKCKFEVVPLCTEKAPECSDSCCKEESSASRFGNLIIQLLSCASEFDKNECSSQQGSNTCCPFSNGAEALTNCNKFTIVSNVLKHCFGCKNCRGCVDSTDHEKLPCEVILFLYDVYDKLCITKMLEPCDHCKKDCIPCTTDSQDDCLCELCLELLEICVDDGDILCCAKCWRCRLRCFVFCGKDCEKCKAGEKKQCGDCSCKPGDSSCSACSTSAGAESQCCEVHCNLTCLINSLFHCEKCLNDTQCPESPTTTTPTTTSSSTTDCLCSKDTMVTGSKIPMSTKCCDHRLGCALKIVNEDLRALKHNACLLSKNIGEMTKQATETAKNIGKLNQALGVLSSLLCYAHCGIEQRRANVARLCEIPKKICENFPCYNSTIKEIVEKDTEVGKMLTGLFVQCIATVVNELRLIQDILWTFATIVAQCLRLNYLNKKISFTNGLMKKNWMSCLNFKGSQTPFWGGYAKAPFGGSSCSGLFGGLAARSCDKSSVNVHVDGELESRSSFVCFKYIWFLLCSLSVVKFFNWFGVENSVSGSMTMLTSITALSAAQLSSAVRGSAYSSASTRGAGCKTGTKINLVVLIGMVVGLVISWICNVISGYSQMSTSLEYITQRMRLVGFYDDVRPPTTQIIVRTVLETASSDVESFVDFWSVGRPHAYATGMTSTQLSGSLALTTSPVNPIRNKHAMHMEQSIYTLMSKQRLRATRSLNSVLNLMSFLQLFPVSFQILNATASVMDDNDMDLGLLLTAWENDTHIIDETLRSMAIHEEVLREVNRDLLRDLQKCRNRAEMMRVYYLWSIYYEGVMNGLPHRVTSARLQLQVLTRGQYLLEKHFIAQQYVEGWEQFCQWLTACSQRVAEQAADDSAKHTKAKDTSTTADTSADKQVTGKATDNKQVTTKTTDGTSSAKSTDDKQDAPKSTADKPDATKPTDDKSSAKSTADKQDTGAEPPTWSMSCLFDGTEDRISAPEPDFSLLDKDKEDDHLRKFVEPADFGKFDVADAFMPDAADFEDIDSPEEQRKLEAEEEDLVKQRNIKVEPGFFHFKDLWQWFRGFDAYSPAGDFEDIDSPEELKKLQEEQAFVEKQANRRVDPGFFQFKDLWQWFRLFDAYNPVGDFDYIDDVVERGRLGPKATKPRRQNNADIDQFVDSQLPDVDNGAFEGSHPLDWLLVHEPCRECIQLFRNSGPMVMSHESEYGDTSSMKAGYIYEEITDAAELLSRTYEWKTSKLEFCGFMGDDMSACIKAVRAAYTRLVAFAERNRGSHNANLIRVFYDGVFSKTKDDTKAKEMTTTKQKITNMVNTLSMYKSLKHHSTQSDAISDLITEYSKMIRKDLDKINKDDSERIPQDLPRLLGHWSVFHAAPITQDGVRHVLS